MNANSEFDPENPFGDGVQGRAKSTSDPSCITAILQQQQAAKGFLETCAIEYSHNPENTFKLGFCRHCGISLGDLDEDKYMQIGPGLYLPNICCFKCSVDGKARLEKERAEEVNRLLERIIPIEFIRWDCDVGNNRALGEARGALNPKDRLGIVLHGPTGTGKTRIAWQLVRDLATAGVEMTWKWYDAYELSIAKAIPAEAFTVDWLFIDDIGNESSKGAWETAFLHLVRKRCDWHKPIILTTQLNGAAFKSRFFSGTAAEAVMRRLRERAKMIAVI